MACSRYRIYNKARNIVISHLKYASNCKLNAWPQMDVHPLSSHFLILHKPLHNKEKNFGMANQL